MSNFIITAFADEIGPDLSEQIRVLKANGISHIELRGIDGKNVSEFTLEEARTYKNQLVAEGINVSSIGSPIGKIRLDEPFAEHLELFRHVLKLAVIFESPYIRMFSFFIDDTKNPDAFVEEVVRRWEDFLEVAKDYPEITLLHENEKDIFGDTADRCYTLLSRLNNPQVKMAFDPANFVQCDVEVYPYAYERLKEYIGYVHIKDARFSDHKVTPAGLGDGEVTKVLFALKTQQFEGFASLEPHLSIFDGFIELEQGNVSISASEHNGEQLFTVASNALKDIVVNDLKLEWK